MSGQDFIVKGRQLIFLNIGLYCKVTRIWLIWSLFLWAGPNSMGTGNTSQHTLQIIKVLAPGGAGEKVAVERWLFIIKFPWVQWTLDFYPWSLGLCTLIQSQLPGEHTAWLCLLVHRTDQSTMPSLHSPVPLLTSLVWRDCGMTYVRLAQGPHYDRFSWDSKPRPSDHLVDTIINSTTVTHRRKGYPSYIQCPANVALVINTFATIQKLKPILKNSKPSTFTEVA